MTSSQRRRRFPLEVTRVGIQVKKVMLGQQVEEMRFREAKELPGLAGGDLALLEQLEDDPFKRGSGRFPDSACEGFMPIFYSRRWGSISFQTPAFPGSTTRTPHPSKSPTFRVASGIPWAIAVAAISMSAWV